MDWTNRSCITELLRPCMEWFNMGSFKPKWDGKILFVTYRAGWYMDDVP